MNDRIVLLKPRPDMLVVRHSVASAGLYLVFHLAFIALWYWLLLERADDLLRGALSENLMIWIFLAAPLLSVPTIVQLVRTCVKGRVYEFDGMGRTVTRNGKDVTRFYKIKKVQLRTIYDPESADEYRLSLVLDDGSKVALAHTTDEEKVAQAADDIADLLNVEVVKK